MRKIFFFCFLFFVFPCFAAYQATDSLGRVIQLSKPARRIISLAPNITEAVFAVGAEKYLIGTSSYSDYPMEAKKIPVVVTFSGLDLEKIVSLKPDLIIAWYGGNSQAALTKLNELGIPVYMASFVRICDIPKLMQSVGELTNMQKTAQKAIFTFQQQYQTLKSTYANKMPVTVFYELSQKPLITLNQHSLVDQAMTLCGGKNIFHRTLGVAPTVNIESVLKRNPEIIFVSSNASEQQAWTKAWQAYPQLQAVKLHHVFPVNANLIERYGPRFMEGAKEICQKIDGVR